MTNIEMVKENAATAEKMVKENVAVAEQMARKIWLAGIGAYGKGYEEAKGRLESLSSDSSKLFAELVKKGESLETEGKKKLDDTVSKVVDKADVSQRVETLRSKLGFDKSEAEVKLEELSAKVDALTEAVNKLAK